MSTIWKDGMFVDATAPQISSDDAGFVNGLGVFDSMLAIDGVLQNPAEHFDRLLHDIQVVMGYDASWLPGFVDMTNIWVPLLSHNNMMKGFARVKTIVTGGTSSGPLKVSNVPSVVVSVARAADPESVLPLTCAIVRDFPRVAGDALENCKRLDYTRSFAARREAQNIGAEEAIITNTQGHIACAATSNVFIRENGKLYTPPLSDGVLAGITRRMILARGEAVEQTLSEDRLRNAEAVYLTNSFTGMREVSKII